MSHNPRLLIRQLSESNKRYYSNADLDAIFIPFKARSAYVNDILAELQWYKGPLYLMPSDDSDMEFIQHHASQKVQELKVVDNDYKIFYCNLMTSKHNHTSRYDSAWDLPEKRNYALLHARTKGYKRILLIDDDIRRLSEQIVFSGSHMLDDYKVTGCFVEDFPDTSIFGHLEIAAGGKVNTFLSGSFLFIRPFDVQSFFPYIYNEDWLFMLPCIIERSICSFGSIKQVPYDPFANIEKMAFQEFGEIIAEGLYRLLELNRYGERHSQKTWKDVIRDRRDTLCSLEQSLRHVEYQNVLGAIRQANTSIDADACVKFVTDWEADTKNWNLYVQEMT